MLFLIDWLIKVAFDQIVHLLVWSHVQSSNQKPLDDLIGLVLYTKISLDLSRLHTQVKHKLRISYKTMKTVNVKHNKNTLQHLSVTIQIVRHEP